jgi:glycosyltransferase involved in cell wall biosynthesis
MRPAGGTAILVPHFQTLELTRICLGLIRRHTRADAEIVIIDNGSADGSGEELRRRDRVRVIRREVPVGERPARSHALALNLGVRETRAELILALHTDTMVLRHDWLDYLRAELAAGGPRCGVVGSWKLEPDRPFKWLGKAIEDRFRRWIGRAPRSVRPDELYPRSHCALYRRSALACHPPMFDPSERASAGQELHRAMLAAGWSARFLDPAELSRHVVHLNHATMALNRQFGADDPRMPRTRARAIRRIERFFRRVGADRILRGDEPSSAPANGSAAEPTVPTRVTLASG